MSYAPNKATANGINYIAVKNDDCNGCVFQNIISGLNECKKAEVVGFSAALKMPCASSARGEGNSIIWIAEDQPPEAKPEQSILSMAVQQAATEIAQQIAASIGATGTTQSTQSESENDMATRATYAFMVKEGHDDPKRLCCYYIHHDGYPEGAKEYLARAVVMMRNGARNYPDLPTQFAMANEGAQICLNHASYGDTEYAYTIVLPESTSDASGCTITYRERGAGQSWGQSATTVPERLIDFIGPEAMANAEMWWRAKLEEKLGAAATTATTAATTEQRAMDNSHVHPTFQAILNQLRVGHTA